MRDEEALLPRCISSINAAVAELVTIRPEIKVLIVFVFDRCIDASAQIVADARIAVCAPSSLGWELPARRQPRPLGGCA